MDDVREGCAMNKKMDAFGGYTCRGEVMGFVDNRKQKSSSY